MLSLSEALMLVLAFKLCQRVLWVPTSVLSMKGGCQLVRSVHSGFDPVQGGAV